MKHGFIILLITFNLIACEREQINSEATKVKQEVYFNQQNSSQLAAGFKGKV